VTTKYRRELSAENRGAIKRDAVAPHVSKRNSIVLAVAVEEGWSSISQLVDFSALGIADAAPQALSSQNNELRTRLEKYHLVCLSRIVGAEQISQAP
jgi:hypothetical protein